MGLGELVNRWLPSVTPPSFGVLRRVAARAPEAGTPVDEPRRAPAAVSHRPEPGPRSARAVAGRRAFRGVAGRARRRGRRAPGSGFGSRRVRRAVDRAARGAGGRQHRARGTGRGRRRGRGPNPAGCGYARACSAPLRRRAPRARRPAPADAIPGAHAGSPVPLVGKARADWWAAARKVPVGPLDSRDGYDALRAQIAGWNPKLVTGTYVPGGPRIAHPEDMPSRRVPAAVITDVMQANTNRFHVCHGAGFPNSTTISGQVVGDLRHRARRPCLGAARHGRDVPRRRGPRVHRARAVAHLCRSRGRPTVPRSR